VVLLDSSLHPDLLGQHHKDGIFLSVIHQLHPFLLSDSSIFVQSGHFFPDPHAFAWLLTAAGLVFCLA